MRSGRAIPVLVAALVLAPAFPARAEPPAARARAESAAEPGEADEAAAHRAEAAQRFAEARALYERGEYRGAIAALEAALELDPSGKELVYNLGVVHEKLGELDEAARWYERYLAIETDEAERERVRGVLRRIEGARRELAAKRERPVVVVAPAEPRPAPAPRARKGRLDGWVWATGGAAVAAAGAATWLGLRALADRPDAPATTGPGVAVADLDAQAARAHRLAIGADVAIAASLAAAGACAWLYFGRDAAAPRAGVGLAPRGAGGAVVVTF